MLLGRRSVFGAEAHESSLFRHSSLISRQDPIENSGDHSIAASSKKLESYIPVCSNEQIQLTLKEGAGATEASLHVFFADPQTFRRFGSTQSLDFPKHEHSLSARATFSRVLD